MIPTELKLAAVREADEGQSITTVARRHKVSRQSVYRRSRTYHEEGALGLREKSRRPRRRPRRMARETEALVCCISQDRPTWGAARVATELERLG
jgi:transposase